MQDGGEGAGAFPLLRVLLKTFSPKDIYDCKSSGQLRKLQLAELTQNFVDVRGGGGGPRVSKFTDPRMSGVCGISPEASNAHL